MSYSLFFLSTFLHHGAGYTRLSCLDGVRLGANQLDDLLWLIDITVDILVLLRVVFCSQASLTGT